MRGSPILRLILTAVFLALAGLPVWSLTRPKAEIVQPSPALPADTADFRLVVTTSSPATVRVSQLGRVSVASDAPGTHFEGRLVMDREHPDDLVIEASWRDAATPQALRIEVKEGDTVLFEQTLWGREALEDAVTLPAL